jgi:hypothetical protein
MKRQISPTGLTVWTIPDTNLEIMWMGPGSGLFVGTATTPGGAVTRIEHRTADGTYTNRREAEAAVKAFLAAGSTGQ